MSIPSDSTNLSYNQYLLIKQQAMAAQPDLPTEFEVIVIGTGLEESIIAAALARNGHNVLHIDTNDYYGDSWASFTFNGLQDWMKSVGDQSPKEQIDSEKLKELLGENETFHALENPNSVCDIKEQWFAQDDQDAENTEGNENDANADQVNTSLPNDESKNTENETALQSESENVSTDHDVEEEKAMKEVLPPKPDRKSRWTKSKMLQERHYNLDLMPRLLYCKGSMVDLLIQSNISRYTEFKAVSRVLTILNGVLEHVPSSRADVFATKHISVVEKRILMKFLTFCLTYDEHPEVYENYVQKTYEDFLKHQKLTDNLIHFIVNSIAMVDKSTNTLEGLKATQKFLSSLGRFGSNTPFLYSSFGSGELPQAFCRLCAVFGGTYFLSRSIEGVITNKENNGVLGIISSGQKITCQKLILPGQICPPSLKEPSAENGKGNTETIYRKLCLTSDSICKSEKEQLTFLRVADKSRENAFTFVTEVGHGASVCPKSMYCLHLTSNHENIDSTLQSIIENNCLWSLDFKVKNECFEAKNAETLFLTSGPQFEVDYDQTIQNAKDIFQTMFPEEPFLPRAPDPEEIILDYANEEPSGDNNDDEEVKDKEQENAGESPEDAVLEKT